MARNIEVQPATCGHVIYPGETWCNACGKPSRPRPLTQDWWEGFLMAAAGYPRPSCDGPGGWEFSHGYSAGFQFLLPPWARQ